jgi:hypothetical protein
MDDRLDATETPAGSAAITVNAKAAVEIKKSRSTPAELHRMRWAEVRAQQEAEKKEREAEKKAREDAAAADKELRRTNYNKWYAQQTAVNGCSIPTDFGKSLWEGQREACNKHDIAYGRGGTEWDRLKADTKLAWDITKQGRPGKALITFAGVRAFGSWFYTKRDKPLPLPRAPGAYADGTVTSPAAGDTWQSTWGPREPGFYSR